MLGRKNFTPEEIGHAQTAIARQIAAYKSLVKAAGAGEKAVDAFEPLFFNNLALALDRCFVHRIRAVTGKDGNPLNELELIAESLMNNNDVMAATNVIKMVPDESVVKLRPGDTIALSLDQFERLSAAFFAELERKFL